MGYFIGTDIGGTFTDLVMLSETGEVTIVKSPTTPSNRTQAVLNALAAAAERQGIDAKTLIKQLQYFAHGTTAATNAFIERKGAKTGLLITRGFADTLRIERCMASWAGLADHEIAHFSKRTIPTPIIPLDLIEEIEETDRRARRDYCASCGSCGARQHSAARRQGRRGDRRHAAVVVSQSDPRTTSRGDRARGGADRFRHDFLRARSYSRRIRTRIDDVDQFVPRSGYSPIHRRAGEIDPRLWL